MFDAIVLFFVVLILFNDALGVIPFGEMFYLFDHLVVSGLCLIGLLGIPTLWASKVFWGAGVRPTLVVFIVLMFLVLTRSFLAGNQGVFAILVGFVYFFKAFLLFFSGLFIGYVVKQGRFSSSIKYFFCFLIFVLLITSFLNLTFPGAWAFILPPQSMEGAERLMGPFTNAGRTSWLIVVCLLFLLTAKIDFKFKSVLLALFLMLLYLTFVKKSFFGFLICSAIYQRKTIREYLSHPLARGGMYAVSALFLVGIGVVFKGSFERMFSEYGAEALTSGNSRFMLALGAMSIVRESWVNLFFGSGLSTWGGYASSIFYSHYYVDLGLSESWGFIKGASTYTGDFYLAHVLAEVGLMGSFLLACLLYYFARMYWLLGQYRTKDNSKIGFLFFLLIIHIYIESLGICALEISQMVIVSSFLPGLYFGKRLREVRKFGLFTRAHLV